MADIKIISPAERYKAIADAIREKNGTTGLLSPADMPQAILDIVGGGGGDVTIGADYTNIVYNDDDTITLTDKDGVKHTMECEYTDGKLTSVKYDGKAVELAYDGDVLVKVGKTEIDMTSVPLAKVEIAKADLSVSPVLKAVADIEASGKLRAQLKGTVTIVGEGKVGETLTLQSEDVDLNKCAFQWYNGKTVKYSHTSNFTDGIKNGPYANSYSKTEVITIEGASSLDITIKWGTEKINYDWVSVYAGNHPDYTAYSSGYLRMFGGADGEETFTIEGDSVTFAFRSDGSGTGSGYGYFAAVTGALLVEGATQETYTIQDEDAQICCEVIGKDDYFGSIYTNILPIGTYSERMYNHYGVDKAEYPYLLISTHSTYSRIEFFTERVYENSSYYFKGYRYMDVNVAEGSDIATIIASHEASDSSKLSVNTGIKTLSNELSDQIYYANFDYTELGYSGLGTWETLE